MSNMSYCRFQNTASDLRDCLHSLRTLNPNDSSFNNEEELRGRREILEMAADLLNEIGIDVDTFEVEKAIEAFDQEEPESTEDDF